MNHEFEAVIVGMGPAGMAAAVELVDLGVNVAAVDENSDIGGQTYRQSSSDLTTSSTSLLSVKYKKGRKLINEVKYVRDKMTLFKESYVWGFFKGGRLSLITNNKISSITSKKLLLAEGAMERSLPFPGWTLPGIMTLGGLQKLILHDKLLPGRRFLLAGCSPLLFPVAASLVKTGAEIVAICDAVNPISYMKLIPKLMRQSGLAYEAFNSLLPVIRKSVPILRHSVVAAASGHTKVREVSVVKLDGNWRPIWEEKKQFQVDIVGVGYGFLPMARLARLCGCTHEYDPVLNFWKPQKDNYMRSSLSDIYVAGDSAGIKGKDLAEVEGRIAATHMAFKLHRLSISAMKKRMGHLKKRQEHIQGYSSMLNKVYRLEPGLYGAMDRETVVCRCEDMTVGDVLEGIEMGYKNINEIKRTRVGMGMCQGKICESIVQQIMHQKGIPIEEIGYLNLRPPLSPIPLSSFEIHADSEI